jgi:hypothetical protein
MRCCWANIPCSSIQHCTFVATFHEISFPWLTSHPVMEILNDPVLMPLRPRVMLAMYFVQMLYVRHIAYHYPRFTYRLHPRGLESSLSTVWIWRGIDVTTKKEPSKQSKPHGVVQKGKDRACKQWKTLLNINCLHKCHCMSRRATHGGLDMQCFPVDYTIPPPCARSTSNSHKSPDHTALVTSDLANNVAVPARAPKKCTAGRPSCP